MQRARSQANSFGWQRWRLNVMSSSDGENEPVCIYIHTTQEPSAPSMYKSKVRNERESRELAHSNGTNLTSIRTHQTSFNYVLHWEWQMKSLSLCLLVVCTSVQNVAMSFCIEALMERNIKLYWTGNEDLRQSSSSEPSGQSLRESQRRRLSRQVPSLHLNWYSVQTVTWKTKWISIILS